MSIDNLITFTILFHKTLPDSYFMSCDEVYIWEKYQKLIGFEPFSKEYEEDWWQSVVLKNLPAMDLKSEWIQKWNYGNKGKKLDPKVERVINYLCVTNTMLVSPSNIFRAFTDHIGEVENVTSVEYHHIHPLVKTHIDQYKTKFQRELNLKSLNI